MDPFIFVSTLGGSTVIFTLFISFYFVLICSDSSVCLYAAFWITLNKRKIESRATSISIRCEQGAKQNNGLDVWLGRLAMVGFATAITVEISTGKGLLEVHLFEILLFFFFFFPSDSANGHFER